jgi:alpha-ketoglutarate-dependent 2,4-dichlorophenoxyacetate dioxygenase
MPGAIQESPFKTIQIAELHPTFGAQVDCVDFPNPSEEQLNEIKAALARVSTLHLQT